MKRFVILMASWGGTGYSPIASGTVGTAAAIPLYLVLTGLPLPAYLLVLVPFFFFSCWISGLAEVLFNEKDSSKIVIDEVMGYLVTMAGVPFSWKAVLAGFFLFRFFDIVKVPPARYFDRQVKNGFGVVMDDVVAGLYSCAFLHLMMRYL